ncbi:hypothetical protein P74p8 [Thermus phage P74-26]|uniref:Uncharacterized protein n=1 Tax=Thermus phage P74-26 TaxID=2914007 RepID=A7XXG9_BP742|nr:hypothetical protein P74p8 [Thermus phage P74-26]ABU96958.1 hypothetical protein P74p8 [Thermus phage P74-26]API81816.1 hypothetical protein G20c_08 [Thermus phage G20c]
MTKAEFLRSLKLPVSGSFSYPPASFDFDPPTWLSEIHREALAQLLIDEANDLSGGQYEQVLATFRLDPATRSINIHFAFVNSPITEVEVKTSFGDYLRSWRAMSL